MKKLRPAPINLPPSLRNIIEYRKSGLSLNHVVGCPLDCAYCVRHLFDNYDMKRPHLIVSDENAVAQLLGHWAFRAHVTPIQVFNRATDPFLPVVKNHLFEVLERLDARGLTNPVLVITRWNVEPEDVARLERLSSVRLTILVTWSGIDDIRIEPVDSAIAVQSLMTLQAHARRTKTIFYWRPLIAGLNDTDKHLTEALNLSSLADATVYTGLFFREEIRSHFRLIGVEDLYQEVARRKIFPKAIEKRVLERFAGRAIFRKTSCGVAYAHGVADFNGHYGIRELCDICPASQIELCAQTHKRPSSDEVVELAEIAGLDAKDIRISDRCITVANSVEQQRYFIQHVLNYQVHDEAMPHLEHRHGRAEVGWK